MTIVPSLVLFIQPKVFLKNPFFSNFCSFDIYLITIILIDTRLIKGLFNFKDISRKDREGKPLTLRLMVFLSSSD